MDVGALFEDSRRHDRRLVEDVLAVVQDQQELTTCQVPDHAVKRRLTIDIRRPDRRGHQADHERWIFDSSIGI